MKAHKMVWKWIGCGLAFWASLETVQGTIIQSWSATSGPMTIDTRANDNVITFGRYWPDQEVCYSGYAWDTRFASETAEVTADGVTLVKSTDEGQVTWRPARVGLHTLHHIAHGGTLTRTYDAEGPTVRIVCTQTGTAGSMLCQIDCDMPNATIYYTTDGTEPTTASCVYTGPFQTTHSKVKRLLAVAVVDGYPMSQTAYPIISVIEDVSVVSIATSGKMVIDTRAGKGSIATDHAEDITYSNLWDGETNAMATVTLDGATLVDSAATEGVYHWEPVKGGTYVFTHTTLKTGRSVGKTLTATFVVPSHDIPIGSITVNGYSGVYDGLGHGIDVQVTSIANSEIKYAYAKTGPYVESLRVTNVCEATPVWYTVAADGYNTCTNWATVTIAPRPATVTSRNRTKVYDGTPLKLTASDIIAENLVAGEAFAYGDLAERTAVGETSATFTVAAGPNTRLENYEVATEFGTLTVTKASVGPGGGGGSEPGTGELPEGAVSKFDGTAVYDGAGHTLATNALVAAFTEAMGGPVDVSYATDAEPNESTVWLAAAPAFTNAGVYKVWYKVANPNYEDFTHAAQVTIAPRPATVTSRNRTKVYDGTPLKLAASDITADNLVAGEAFVYGDLAERTDVGETEATFTVVAGEGTMLANYAITTSFGTLSVTKATYPGQEPGGAGIAWSVASDGADWMYDGQAHGVTLTGVPAGVEAHLAGNTATDAGSYTATVTFSYDTKNYEPPVAPDPIHWTISPRPITLMAAAKEKPYDGFPLTVKPGDITASGSGYATGECFEYFDFASITDVGETAATFSYRDSATAKVSNYAVTVKGGQTLRVTVGGDQISVTADSGTWAYDGAEHCAASWRVENGDKLLAGHELRVAIDPASVVRTPEDGPDGDGVVSNRFASVRIVEAATGADRTRNYTLVLKEGVLKMTNACIRAENLAGTVDIRKVYDGVATQAVVSATLLRPATVRYATGDTLPADGWSAKPTAFVHAGTQTVWYAVEAQYHDPYTNSLDVAILPRPVTLTTPTKSKTYDGAPLSFGTDEVEVGGEGYVQDESFAFSDFASISDAGRIAATCAYEAGAGTRLSDYAIAENWGTLTVLASADEIAVTAGSATWPYDGTEHRLATYTAENADKLQPGDELVVEFAPESVALTPEDGPNRDGVVSNAIVSVRVVRNGTEDVTRNYSLAWYPGVLRVTKAQVTFAGEGSADPSGFAATATYDGQGHAAAVVPPVLLTSPVAVRYGRAADATSRRMSRPHSRTQAFTPSSIR